LVQNIVVDDHFAEVGELGEVGVDEMASDGSLETAYLAVWKLVNDSFECLITNLGMERW
jgi:hypothetical protein